MKYKIKQFGKIIVFLLIFIYLFIHISYMVRGEIAHTRYILNGYYAEEKNSLDAVFIGTSGTFSSFAPMDAYKEYGFTSYNYCTNVMGADVMTYSVKEVMKTQKPKVMVIDVYPFIIKNKLDSIDEYSVRYNTDGLKYSLNRFSLIHNEVPEDLDKFSFYFDIIKYHANSFNWANYNNSSPFSNKGYIFLPWGIVDSPSLTEERVSLDSDYDVLLDELIAECQQVDVPILFIYYPYGKICDSDMANVNYVQDKIENAGFSFLNCESIRDQFGLDNAIDYWDPGHFNIYGAEKVTRVVGSYLQTTYNLPDRRNNKAYEEWKEEVYTWNNSVKAAKAEIDAAILTGNSQ